MPEEKMWVRWDDDTELSKSQKRPGELSALTRDGDNNLGHATLRPVDEQEDEDDYDYEWDSDSGPRELTVEEELAALVILGVIVAAVKAAPHALRWWRDSAVPFLQRSKNRPPRDGPDFEPVSLAEFGLLPEPEAEDPSREAVAALDEYRETMGSSEARQRLVAALVARAFSEEQLRVLRTARIEDDQPALEVASAMIDLTPQQLGESITLMLEANPSWPDRDTLAELEEIIDRRRRGDDEPAQLPRVHNESALPPPVSGD